MKNLLNRKNKIIISILAVLLIFFSKVYKDKFMLAEDNIDTEIGNNIKNENESSEDIIIEKDDENVDIYVHVCGEVKEPGLVKLESGARVIDAINAVGGLYDTADLDSINLAKKLEDEDKIYVPKKGEIEKSNLANISEKNKVNINEATIEELKTLPGVGEKTAKKIVEYRLNKNFKKTQDIMNVPGFGEKKFQEIENYIKVN